MWKDNLPDGCPPKKAIEQEIEVYRVLNESVPNEADFYNYFTMYPENPRYKSLCKAYALSFYDSVENAILALSRSTNLKGTHIGKYRINKTHGTCEFKQLNGHYSIWLYNSWSYNNFNPINIIPISGN